MLLKGDKRTTRSGRQEADGKKPRNAGEVLPVVNAESAGDKETETALGKLTSTLTTEDVINPNLQAVAEVAAERLKSADVTQACAESKGLVKK
ncbi:hypothetical protein [Streptomyces sp. NPDC054765]